jgi:two-component sensor histidine kinase
LANVADNLQLIADLGYADTALAVAAPDGHLSVAADARPSTAMPPFRESRAGVPLDRATETAAYRALEHGRRADDQHAHHARGGAYSTFAYPIGSPDPYAVVLRTFGAQVEASAGRMERAFIESADDLIEALRTDPLLDARTNRPFWATRRAGDGVMRVTPKGRVAYASPNAVTIMRLAGVSGRVTGMNAAELPGGGSSISPILGTRMAVSVEMEVAERALGFRSLGTPAGALVLVEDLTEARRRERELELKEATIREVHHRVKNNLQTIASLLRIQARRSGSDEARRALLEATERAASMAAVHDMLAHSERECVDFAAVARTVVELVRRGLLGDDQCITVIVSGETGEIDANPATSLALALAELAHNALEHAFEPHIEGRVDVDLERADDGLTITVRDDGCGLPSGFDPATATSMGFSIVRRLVEDDLRGRLRATTGDGTTVTVWVPLAAGR